MDKDKLISLIIRKQTYKDTKNYLSDLAKLKDQAAQCSHLAVKEILTTDYNAEAKLYAVRYLKDAFEKGNPTFIGLVERDLLPILVGISVDENDEKAVVKYAGSSFTKNEELAKFKSIISSLFRMVKECIIRWAEWIPDPARNFSQAFAEIKRRKVDLEFQWKYFRPQHEQIFRENCLKNGVKIVAPQSKATKTVTESKAVKGVAESKAATPKPEPKKVLDPQLMKIQQYLQKIKNVKNQAEVLKLENDFNQAINNYLQSAEEFNEEQFQNLLDQFERRKKIAQQSLKNTAVSNVKGSKAVEEVKGSKIAEEIKGSKVGEEVKRSKVVEEIKGSKAVEEVKRSKAVEEVKEKSAKKVEKIVLPSKTEVENIPVAKESLKTENKVEKKLSEKQMIKPLQKEASTKQLPKKNKEIPMSVSIEEKKEKTSPKQIAELGIKSQISKPKQVKNIQSKSIKMTQPLPKQPPKQQKKQLKAQTTGNTQNIQIRVISQLRSQKNQNQVAPLVVVPTPTKKGPIVFDEQQSPFDSSKRSQIRSPKRQESKKQISKYSNTNKSSKPIDMSISKQDQSRVDFSMESQQFSQQPQTVEKPFKRKEHLSPIVEEGQFDQPRSSVRSRGEEESFLSREKKGQLTHKLIEENKQITEKYKQLAKDFALQQQQKLRLRKENQAFEKEMKIKVQNEDKLIKKLNASVPMSDYQQLRKQLEQQKQRVAQIQRQNTRILTQNQSLIEELNQTKYKLKSIKPDHEKSRSKVIQQDLKVNAIPLITNTRPVSSRIVPTITKQQLDPDYVKNLTHTSNLHNLMSKVNLIFFRKNALGLSDIFFRDEYLTIIAKSSIYTQNNQQFVSLKMEFQLKSVKQSKLQVRYKNCQELDVWVRPLMGQGQVYVQELAIRLHTNPLKVIKAQAKVIESIDINFYLPILYLNFLREQQFSNDEFQDIYALKSQQLLKSKISQFGNDTIKQPSQLCKLFKHCIITGDKFRFCLAQGIDDRVFMCQLQLLRNNKFLIRMLTIPTSEQMGVKGKELMENLIFLLS